MNQHLRRAPHTLFFSLLLMFCGSVGNVPVFCQSTGQPSVTEPWARFRGANGLGTLELPNRSTVRLSETPQWQLNLAGNGNGSPVIFQQRVFVQSADSKSGKQFLQCVNLVDGAELWTREFPGQAHQTHAWGSLASSTPTVDANRVYFCWGSPEHTHLAALTHDGKMIWQRDLGPNRFEHGFGSSPALIGDRLIFFHSQDATEENLTPKFSRMLSLEPATGKTVWETSLEKTTRVCYGVPVEITLPSGKLGILAADTGHGIFCLDAESGSLLWEQPVIKQRAVSGALASDGLALASSGSGGGGNQLVAIRLADQQEVYRISRNANYVPMPVAVGDKLFVPNDKGILSCCQLATGEILQQQRVDEQRFNISSSLVALGQVLLVLSDEGKLKVISADEDLKTLQAIDLGEPTRATPALHQDAVIFRTETQLHCFGIK